MRHRLFTLLLGLAVLITAGCGFHLRGATQVPEQLQKLVLDSSDPYGPLTRAVREQLRLNGVEIIADAARQDIPSLRILNATESKDTVSIFQDGKTAEYQMVLTLRAQVLLPGENIYPLNVTVFRTFFDNPLAALAKDAEQDIIRQEMRDLAAAQLVRNLLTVKGGEEEKNRRQSSQTAALSSPGS
ncbi:MULTISPECIES: LPS assembly lipoprotein LptE [unclassified Brenneria]|uniref:LPS assembly lipoprotein LptE n=1 Tax=unclassified Brenneria TaxID=2634434 RepID=UPI0029C3EEF7|nr:MULTISPECIES: LPS assembly lipoprotein LptE [unclassified Brenneria]MDX5627905.1 LPS assembly lipoprotein LptE [Brenneria sp. L3-3Z]MDX5694743.1 LPS assembly lipoprotein LptE [Brenneria sp. L4-2C]MEE3660531.1 LPS assembly lipoprotein LptE [Brenneria sp. g21c3]